MKRSICTILAALLLPSLAHADTYVVPEDAQLSCFELSTGKLKWRRSPGKVSVMASLGVLGSGKRATIVAQGWASRGNKRPIVGAVRRDGTALSKKQRARLAKRTPAPPLGEAAGTNLVDSKKRRYEFSQGNTRHLRATVAGVTKLVTRLDTYPNELTIAGDLAIFTYNSGTDGGEVIAYDVVADRLRWKFDAWRRDASIPHSAYTSIGADADAVYVSVDQSIHALDLATGVLRWKRALPRQSIRRYDAPWTQFGRHGKLLIAQVYEDLFALDAATGALRWSIDAGRFAKPWPVILGDELFILTRDGPVQQSSASFVGKRPPKTSAVEIRRRGKTLTMKGLSTRDIPAKASSWFSLSPPPAPAKPGPRKIELVLSENGDTTVFDLRGPLAARRSTTYVSFHGFHDVALLRVDGNIVAKVKL